MNASSEKPFNKQLIYTANKMLKKTAFIFNPFSSSFIPCFCKIDDDSL